MLLQFRFSSFLLFLTLQCSLLAQTTGTLRGTVTDARTGEPLIGATVLVLQSDYGVATDVDGRFEISGIPVETYNVQASYVGYENSTRFNVVVRSEGNQELNFELTSSTSTLDEVVVTPNPFEKTSATPLSIQSLSQEEITQYPGGNNDIAKVVQTLPGVSGSVGGFRNDVIIRGGAPNENVYFLDDVPIPNINHFSSQGSAGGPVGLLNVSFFEGVTLSASAFGAQYNNALSGVLQFDQRTGNPQEFTGNIRVSSSEAALTLEGPLNRSDGETKTTYIVSARRSYLQVLFELIGLPFLPDYWDYQYKINHKIDDYNTIYLTGVGSIDDFRVNELDEFDPVEQAQQDQVPVIRQRTNTIGASWRRRFKDDSGYMQTTISNNFLDNQFQRFNDNIEETGLFFRNDSRETETRLRYNLTKFLGPWTLLTGFNVINADYQNTTEDLVEDRQFSSNLNFFRYGVHAQASRRFFDERLSFSFGLRADGDSFTEDGNQLQRTLSPRVSLSYALTQNGKWSLNTSLGRYYKILPYTSLGFQGTEGNFVNQGAEYIRSGHAVLGVEYLLNKSSRITVEGFYKAYGDYPVSIADGVSLANKGGDFEVYGSEPIRSSGEGRAYGVELLYQQKFTGRFYAIGALTLYKSEFTTLENDEFKPAIWDNQVLVSLIGGYKLGRNWEVSARYRYLGEAPYAPVDQMATLQRYPAIIRDFDRLGTVRLDPFTQLDIRIDKKWSFSAFSLDVFLEVQNALASDNPELPQYGLARNENGEVTTPEELVQVSTTQEGEVLPSIGIVVNF